MSIHAKRPIRLQPLILPAFLALTMPWAEQAAALPISKANNTNNLNLGVSWIGGTVPGTNDIGLWDTNSGSQTVSLGGNLSWQGVLADPAHSGNVTINAGNTLTVGSAGIFTWPNITFTLNNLIALASDQTWGKGIGTTIYGGDINMNGFTLTLTGGGTHQFKCAVTNGGGLDVYGNAKFSNGTSASNSDVVLESSANLTFDVAGSVPARAKSITMRGATLTQTANANTLNDLIGPLAIESGYNTIAVGSTVSKTTLLAADSLTRSPGSAVVIKGNNLGVSGLVPLVTNGANFKITLAPTLYGGGGAPGTVSNSILIGAAGDTNGSVTGYGALSGGLLTYDTNLGVRVLDWATEYTPALTGGLANLDNIRLANNTGTQTLYVVDGDSSVNSLSFAVFGVTNSAILVTGSGRLTLRSGVLFGNQTLATSTDQDRMSISNAVLDLNGREGVILYNTANSSSTGTGGGLLEIASKITHDDGNGLLFAGEGGTVKLMGTATNDYTGLTTLVNGRLWLYKSVGVNAVPGHLLVMGGAVINRSNQIPDDSDITIRGGAFVQAASLNTGSGASEKFRDLFIYGGYYNSGASGTSSGLTTNRTVSLAGGSWNITKGHRATTTGSMSLSGGTNNLYGSNDSSSGGRLALYGSLSISNPAAGAYTPVIVNNATGTAPPAQLTLSGDLAFFGNAANTNPATITQGSGGLPGRLLLDGLRTFSVENGPAAWDLVVSACITNNGATNGGLVKADSGTLALTAGTNYYTGPTLVSNGVLVVAGRLASPVSLSSNAVLTGAGVIAPTNATALSLAGGAAVNPGPVGGIGSLTVTGNVSFAQDAVLQIDADGATADLLAVSGSVTATQTRVRVSGKLPGATLVMTAGAITGSFTTDARGFKATVKDSGLWLERAKGAVIVVN